MRGYLPAFLLFATFASPCQAQTDSELQNWFHDPFFQISGAIPDCPMPAGPFTTEVQRTAEAHHRAERGTTCWLEGKCDRPSSYDYDQDIASAFKNALSADNPFKDSTLWVTVQGRVVFIEGCADDHSLTAKLEKFAMTLPFVEVAVAKIRYDPSAQPPYTIFKRH
jgi:hypothetical protein